MLLWTLVAAHAGCGSASDLGDGALDGEQRGMLGLPPLPPRPCEEEYDVPCAMVLLPAITTAVTAAGGYAYVGHLEGISVVDVRTPGAPRIAGEVTMEPVYRLAVAEKLVGLTEAEVVVFDLSSPESPSETARVPLMDIDPWYAPGLEPAFVGLSNGRPVVITAQGLWILDAEDPTDLSLIQGGTGAGAWFSARVYGTKAYLAHGVEYTPPNEDSTYRAVFEVTLEPPFPVRMVYHRTGCAYLGGMALRRDVLVVADLCMGSVEGVDLTADLDDEPTLLGLTPTVLPLWVPLEWVDWVLFSAQPLARLSSTMVGVTDGKFGDWATSMTRVDRRLLVLPVSHSVLVEFDVSSFLL